MSVTKDETSLDNVKLQVGYMISVKNKITRDGFGKDDENNKARRNRVSSLKV